MRALLTDLLALVSFDIVKLPGRLRGIDSEGERATMVMFTMIADSVRFFMVVCAVAVLLL